MLLEQHLACAAAESYLLLQADDLYFGPKIFKAAETLVNEGRMPASKNQLYSAPLHFEKTHCTLCVN